MDHKSSGIEFDREAFASAPPAKNPNPIGGIVVVALVAAVVLGLGFVVYKAFNRETVYTPASEARALADMQQRLGAIEDRLDQLEQDRKKFASMAANAAKQPEPVAAAPAPAPAPRRSSYEVSAHVSQPAPPVQPATDPAVNQKLAGIQQGMGSLQSDATANKEAWEATTDRLADVAGQIGSQHAEMIKSQQQLDQLLSRTSLQAIPFELRRGTNRQPLGPIALALKASSLKSHRYTVCVYVQDTCIELKDRNLFEVVQFAITKDGPPMEIIATKVDRDGIVGYLEVPREKAR
jgi:hypothetical protein